LYAAAVIALFAELAVFGGAWVLLGDKPATPPVRPKPPVTITLAPALQPTPAPAVHPAPAPAPRTQPQPQPRTTPAHPAVPTRHIARATPPPQAATPPMPAPTAAPAPAAPLPSTTPTEAAPPQPAAPAAPAVPAGPTPSFEGALRAAIEAALRYPEAARMAGMSGRTRVAFRYRDGVVSDVSVVISSGMGVLDRAALAAVRDANCPKPEPAFAGKTLSEQLWVNFNLNDHE
jgi:protein TonB